MKILVTGATGFVGRHITQRLKELDHDVYVLVRNPKKLDSDFPNDKIISLDLKLASVEEIKANIPSDFDGVIHTAGIVHSFSTQDFYDINSKATLNLYKALNENVHFIFLSSLAACGPSKKNKDLTEDDSPGPLSEYGRSKLEAEQNLIEMSRSPGLKTPKLSILRPPMVVGPGDQGVLEIIKMIQSGLVITTGRGGLNKRYSFVSVFDLTRACVELLKCPQEEPQIFFCSHPQTLKLGMLAKSVQKELGVKNVRQLKIPHTILKVIAKSLGLANRIRPHSLRLTPDKLNELIPEAWTCSGQKLCETTDFKYEDSLEKILPKTLDDYRERGWI